MQRIFAGIRTQLWVLTRGWQLAGLPRSLRGRTCVLLRFAVLFAQYRLHRTSGRLVTLDLGEGRIFRVRDHTEALVLCEVFVDECYAHSELPDAPEVIVDLGCNIGAVCSWFKSRYPAARIVGVEADPQTAELARLNTRELCKVEIVQLAVTRANGTVSLWRSDQSSWASGLTKEGRAEPVEVEGITLVDLLKRLDLVHVDILKVDIEGAEHEVFEDPSSLNSVEVMIGEYHRREGNTWVGFVAHLPEFSFSEHVGDGGAHDFAARRRERLERPRA